MEPPSFEFVRDDAWIFMMEMNKIMNKKNMRYSKYQITVANQHAIEMPLVANYPFQCGNDPQRRRQLP